MDGKNESMPLEPEGYRTYQKLVVYLGVPRLRS